MRRDSLDRRHQRRRSTRRWAGRSSPSGTALLTALALFFFGGEVLHGFAFTMIVGIITGTYSSVFIAAAIVSFWRGTAPTRAAAHAPAARRAGAAAAAAHAEAAAQGAGVSGRAPRVVAPARAHADARSQAALLGVVQGLTEFLPVSSHGAPAHRASACFGFERSGGVVHGA